ncbi:hypothetical protein WJX72_000567 [[Myrmecia] bisecta]|uniref:CSN8/PSMD8/EIF3K domain-containing protein n=1 Tax=[Myrmecia] bisecta TaxID=41462 RepID=A0AAW1QBD8_9CHLO
MAAYGHHGLQDAFQTGKFGLVAGILDELELQSADFDVPDNWPHAAHMLGHMYNGDLVDARFVWKRLPEAAKQTAEVQAALTLLQCLWSKDYEGTWAALSSHAWNPPVSGLVGGLALKTREHIFELLTRAYSHIPTSKAAALLGLPEQETLQLVQQQGWEHDPATAVLKVHQPPVRPGDRTSLDDLQRLTEYVAHLEQD